MSDKLNDAIFSANFPIFLGTCHRTKENVLYFTFFKTLLRSS